MFKLYIFKRLHVSKVESEYFLKYHDFMTSVHHKINREIFEIQSAQVSNLFELLVTSSSDYRYNQWINCFAILFKTPVDTINEEFELLRGFIRLSFTQTCNLGQTYSV